MRVAVLRTGVVLSPDGGALTKMLPFFKLGVGGPVAGGGQYMSWVHVADVTGAIELALDDQQAAGPINVVAPDAPTNTEFSKALGRALHRPAVLPVPGFALRLLYGEMSVTVTASQRLVPRRLTELGYSFRQGELEPALRDAIAS
jgi:hypothetical protein